MPGSSAFAGEFLVLNGIFTRGWGWAVVGAIADRAGGDVHAARDLRGAAPGEGPVGPRSRPRSPPGGGRIARAARGRAPLPQLLARRASPTTASAGEPRACRDRPSSRAAEIAVIETPTIDWAALSPYLALLAGVGAGHARASVFARGAARNGLGACHRRALPRRRRRAAAIVLFTHDDDRRGHHRRLAAHATASRTSRQIIISWRRPRSPCSSPIASRRGTSGAARSTRFCSRPSAAWRSSSPSNDLITLFLGLEWFSISLYILCAITLEPHQALEAGLKYLIAGSFGSAILLFGSALVYGATGEIGFAEIAAAAPSARRVPARRRPRDAARRTAFKASAAPFHQWTPDVYDGAPLRP